MWNRKAFKRQGKAAFRRNYWKAVLAALVLLIAAAGAGVTSSVTSNLTEKKTVVYETKTSSPEEENSIDGWEYKEDFQGGQNQSFGGFGSGSGSSSGNNSFGSGSSSFGNGYGPGSGDSGAYGQMGPSQNSAETETVKTGSLFSAIWAILAGIAAIVLYILFRIFVGNPTEAGAKRFFLMNLKAEPADLKEIAYPFDHSWKNTGKVLFFRDLHIFLWGLLFVIPGIVKSYEYRLIPYILAENPETDQKAAFALSKSLMQGHKWQCFVLDLSFIGWYLLSAITGGLAGVFYVNPYIYSTEASMYAFLRYREPSFRRPDYVNYGPENPQPAPNPYEQAQPAAANPYEQAQPAAANPYEQVQPAAADSCEPAAEQPGERVTSDSTAEAAQQPGGNVTSASASEPAEEPADEDPSATYAPIEPEQPENENL